MAGRAATKQRVTPQLQVPAVDDAQTQRAIDVLTSIRNDRPDVPSRQTIETDLVIGTNKIKHGLGRAYFGYNLTPSVADATFAHAHDFTNPRPDLEVWIVVIGANQPRARLEIH